MARWETVSSEVVENPEVGPKDVVHAWLVLLRESSTGTEHTGRVEIMDSAASTVAGICEQVVATSGMSAFDSFLDHQQPPLLVYITSEGVTVPSDGIYEGPMGS